MVLSNLPNRKLAGGCGENGFCIFGAGPSYVISVEKSSVAHQSGLCPGDQLIELNGFNVSAASNEMIKSIARSNTMETPVISVISRLKFIRLEADSRCGYGVTLQGVKPTLVATVDPLGPAYEAGIRPNDLILEINGLRLRSLRAAASVLKEKHGSTVLAVVAMDPPNTTKHDNKFPANSRILKAKTIFSKMNETFKEDFKKKMVLIKLLKMFAEDRDVVKFAKSLEVLFAGFDGKDLISDLRKFIPMEQNVEFDEILFSGHSNHVISLKDGHDDDDGFINGRKHWEKGALKKEGETYGLILKGRSPMVAGGDLRGGGADRAGIGTGDALNGLDVRDTDLEIVTRMLQSSKEASFELDTINLQNDDIVSDKLFCSSSSSPSLSSSLSSLTTFEQQKTLLTQDEAKLFHKVFKTFKEKRDVNKLVSSLKGIPDTEKKKTLRDRSFEILKEISEDDDDDSDDYERDSYSIFESTIGAQLPKESVYMTFKKDLNFLLNSQERECLRKALKIYKSNKNVHSLLEDLCHLLDTPSKQTLWTHILRIVPRRHMEYCTMKIPAFMPTTFSFDSMKPKVQRVR